MARTAQANAGESDDALMACVAARDADALRLLADRHAEIAWRIAYRMLNDAAEAEDVAQEAMLRLWQHAAGYDPARSAVSTWLFRIARNLHIDRLRREANRPQVAAEPIEADIASEPHTTEEYADHVQLQRRIDTLSSIQARLIRMSYFEAKSHQEIATELGMPLGTVKSHLRRAFLRLQGEIGEVA